MLDPQQWTSDLLARHSVDPRQFADFRASTLANGSRIIDAYNASGLHFTILPDRGLDIWTAHYKGIPLTWIAQGSPFPPDFGSSWLQQFNGGLLTTCGLLHAGWTETDEISGESRELHGRYNRLRAADVSVERSDTGLTLRGAIHEQRLFGEQLRLQRSYSLPLAEPAIQISDAITNISDQPAPLMLLYHINVGFPLVSAGAELHTPYHAVYAREQNAAKGYDRWPIYDAPEAGRAEQVYFHHLKQNAQQRTGILLQNGDFGFGLEWDAPSMPYFTQWKNTRERIYVCGIEPGNCIPEGQNAARRTGRLVTLAPGQTVTTFCQMRIHDGAQAVQAARQRIDDLQSSGTPSAARLSDFAGK